MSERRESSSASEKAFTGRDSSRSRDRRQRPCRRVKRWGGALGAFHAPRAASEANDVDGFAGEADGACVETVAPGGGGI